MRIKPKPRNIIRRIVGTHQCHHCDKVGNLGPEMSPISEVAVKGYRIGLCGSCRDHPACAVCHVHPQESGEPTREMHGVQMCKPCRQEARRMDRMMAVAV
jgi:hypothetical protein